MSEHRVQGDMFTHSHNKFTHTHRHTRMLTFPDSHAGAERHIAQKGPQCLGHPPPTHTAGAGPSDPPHTRHPDTPYPEIATQNLRGPPRRDPKTPPHPTLPLHQMMQQPGRKNPVKRGGSQAAWTLAEAVSAVPPQCSPHSQLRQPAQTCPQHEPPKNGLL